MTEINPMVMVLVADKLDRLGLNYAFVGGSIVALLLDHAALSPVRPTDDLDVIIQVTTGLRYCDIEAKLRQAGFAHDTRQGAPMCRWLYRGLTIDIMPADGGFMGLNTAWFKEALESAITMQIGGSTLKIISPVAFIASKLAAFGDRGKGDYFGSHDLEDLMTVIDGRKSIVEEIAAAPKPLRSFIVRSVRDLHQDSVFQEACPGFLPPDDASQRRLPLLRQKLASIAKLPI
jgi:predicted nucleotidyltransferase